MTRVSTALIACAIAGAGLLGFASCGEERDRGAAERVTVLPEFDQVIGEELMLALHQAKNFHHIADVYLHNGKTGKAIEAVQQILSIPFPADAPEAEDVLLDARARLAKLLVVDGRVDEAMKLVDAGIASARRDSFFLSNLHTVRGEVLEARAVTLEATDPAAATAAREQAIAARLKSIEIDRALQESLMRGGGE
jgi:tetratricopeptide (TPR) repeat protein